MYELKLAGGKTVVWQGKDGLDACHRYADAHPGSVVIAWREADRVGLHVGLLPIEQNKGGRP